MAFRRKDVKKASYYVWFLGAKESKGLRGDEYVVPVLRFLLDKERQYEPSKVTLQVSNKGIKIIQTLNVPRKNSGSSGFKSFNSNILPSKTEQIKHMIPHHSITWVSQEEDIICCIMLIYNPITKCPVHVHAYRCDSIETATTLRNQLQILIDRPENQKKFREIEMRLAAKGLMPTTTGPVLPGMEFNATRKTLNSDGRSTRTEGSDNTDDSLGSDLSYGNSKETSLPIKPNQTQQPDSNGQVPMIYESLAAELRAKLGNPKTGPILLPPRDYDTISRKRGKLEGIELRKSTNRQIVGPLEHKISPITRSESSGKSSGIGSDEALSSAIQEIHPDYDDDPSESSTDDEDWIVDKERCDRQCSQSPVRHKHRHFQKSNEGESQNYRKHWSERNYEWDKSHPSKTYQRQQSKTQVQSNLASKSKPPQKFYFPDPTFTIPNPEPVAGRSRSEQRLHRRQSNPDYFRSVSPTVEKPAVKKLEPTTMRFSHNRVDDMPPSRTGVNNQHYYGRDKNISSIARYNQSSLESAQPRTVSASNRHSFLEKPMRRSAALHY